MKSRPVVVLVADTLDALVRVCGVTMIDRLLRTIQREGFKSALVLASQSEAIRVELDKPSWARRDIMTEMCAISGTSLTFGDLDRAIGDREVSHVLLLSAGAYFDSRLIEALLAREKSAALVDSNPEHLGTLGMGKWDARMVGRDSVEPSRVDAAPSKSICGAFLLETGWIRSRPAVEDVIHGVEEGVAAKQIALVDVAAMPSFQVSMRRNIRPLWFPAPNEVARSGAEELVLDTAQKGAMEMISYLETPVENLVMRRIWNTSITPIQITVFGLVVGLAATVAFVFGYLWIGALLALSVGVIDGLDGKQARVKVETTEFGRWEGEMDYPVQMSWWIALAYYFSKSVIGSHAIGYVVLFLVADWVDKLFTHWVKKATGRYLENYAWIDGVVRFFGGPRSLYVCMLIGGLILKRPERAFVLICCWHAAIAAIHGLRAGRICSRKRV